MRSKCSAVIVNRRHATPSEPSGRPPSPVYPSNDREDPTMSATLAGSIAFYLFICRTDTP